MFIGDQKERSVGISGTGDPAGTRKIVMVKGIFSAINTGLCAKDGCPDRINGGLSKGRK